MSSSPAFSISYGSIPNTGNSEQSVDMRNAGPKRKGYAYVLGLFFIVASVLCVSVVTFSPASSGLSFTSLFSVSKESGSYSSTTSSTTTASSTTTGSSTSSSTASSATTTGSTTSSSTTKTTTTDIDFSLFRVGYDAVELNQEILNYKFLKGYDAVIEPYATMQIQVTDYSSLNDVYYKFKLCADDSGICNEGSLSLVAGVTSTPVMVKCSPYDTYSIKVAEIDVATGSITRTTTGKAMAMYIRREMRSLTETDLSTFMDALEVMYSVDTTTGQELYGDDYRSSSYLLSFHHFNSAWQESDHIHEGNGFLMQHVKMTNMVDDSLKAIDPSIALPYWDFTIDQANGKSSITSDVMTSTTFGSMKAPTSISWGYTYENDKIVNGAISDGRFKALKAEMNTLYSDLKTGYGYMRAPWNMNPSPYISRFAMDFQIGTYLPSCQQHYDMLEYDDMMDYFYDIQYGPHATTHSLTGGIYGCDLMKPLLEAGYINDEKALKTICSSWLFYVKEFYRYDYISPKTDCVVADDIQSSECGFTLNDEMEADFMFNLKTKLTGNVPTTMTETGWNAWKDFICGGNGGKIFSGDHLESASPADPSFWVIHPTLERLTQAKLMAGGFSSEKWANDPKSDDVCDKAECYMEKYSSTGYYTECCYGHYEDSKILDFASGNKTNHIGATNLETFRDLDPRRNEYSMSYIYDGFTWDHCTSNDFDGLIKTLVEARRRR